MNRKKYILCNWKLHKNCHDITNFFVKFNKYEINNKNIVCGFAPTHLGLGLVSNLKKDSNVTIAQDVSNNLEGSYTGQISCLQLKDFHIGYAIVGHSEARKYLGCDDKIVNTKVLTCLQNNIHPIICIGESLQEYNKHLTKKVLSTQLKTIFKNVKEDEANKCIIAYEPLWAIGSGKTPSLEEINNLCGYIRLTIKTIYNQPIANKLPILYGGSVNEKNALDIITLSEVDGSLIGGASLYPDKVIKILKDLNKWLTK